MTEKKSCCAPQRPDRAKPDKAKNLLPIEVSEDGARADAQDIIALPETKGFIGTDRPVFEVDEEAPYRGIKLKPFWIDATTVTNAQFAEFVAQTGYKTEAETLGNSFVFAAFLADQTDTGNAVSAAPWWRLTDGACWHRPAGHNSDITALPDHPVVHISWNDAQGFASWAGGRLPTEAEWEHAARGGLGDAAYPWGDEAPNDTDFFPCNIWQGQFPENNLCKDGFSGTAPAHSFQPNGYGLYNMVGNVWEWTQQSFKLRSLKKALRQIHRDKAGFKICKGGSYLCHASYCHRYRIAARTANSPDSSTGHTGFRLVYDTPPKDSPAKPGRTA